jgi:hypothetical protein
MLFTTDPEIKEIDTIDYTGVVGSVIKILVLDIIKLQSVKVSITTANGTFWKKAVLFLMLIASNGCVYKSLSA